MVLTLIIPLRSWYKLQDMITMRHMDCCAKVMLGTGLIVAYGYSRRRSSAWYSGDKYESFMYWNRMTGPYGIHLRAADSVQYRDSTVAVVSQSAA